MVGCDKLETSHRQHTWYSSEILVKEQAECLCRKLWFGAGKTKLMTTFETCEFVPFNFFMYSRVFREFKIFIEKKAEPTNHKPGGYIERIQKDF